MSNERSSDIRPTVVICAAALAPEALALLERAGFTAILTSGYPTEEELLASIKRHRPVALLHRQGYINGTVLDAGGSNLRMVARHGAGLDGIDIPAAISRGVTVTRAAGANSRAVAEHTWAMLMAALKDIPAIDAGMARNLWEKTSRQTRDAEGKTIGIVGYGAIGSKVARYAEAFGMSVFAYDPYLPETGLPGPGERVSTLHELLTRAQVLSLHCPLTSETRHMIGAEQLALLPKGALLVNAARGGIVDETAMLATLDDGHLAAAAVDVFETEPLADDSPLRRHPKIITTPHIAANSVNGAVAMATGAADCIVKVLAGQEPLLKGAIVSLGERTPMAVGQAV